ncbi:hypothetical protein ACFL54_02880 [Planctomycetota bacterium]
MEELLSKILQKKENLDAELQRFCTEYFVSYFHFKPLFGGILVEVGGRINMDLMLKEDLWPSLFESLHSLPEKQWRIQDFPLKNQTLLKVTFLEGIHRREFQRPFSLEQLGLSGERVELLTKAVQQKKGMVIITGPQSNSKTHMLHTLASMACSQEYRRGGGWVGASHSPQIENFSWFNCSGVDEFVPRELSKLLKHSYDVIAWEVGHNKQIWELLLQAARYDRLVIVSLHEKSTVDAMLLLTKLGVVPEYFAEVKLLLAMFPLEKTGPAVKNKNNYGEITSVFEYLEVDDRILPVWQHGGNAEQLIEEAAAQESFWTLYADAFKGIEQGLFDAETVKARLTWITP